MLGSVRCDAEGFGFEISRYFGIIDGDDSRIVFRVFCFMPSIAFAALFSFFKRG